MERLGLTALLMIPPVSVICTSLVHLVLFAVRLFMFFIMPCQATEIYLFDWGNTLMVDFPDAHGKMCDWERVETIEGAEETLACLSGKRAAKIFIATGAADSSEEHIKAAFKRVDLDSYITGYFCKSNLGVGKESADFFPRILRSLNIIAEQVTMVGDNLQQDIEPAIACGMNGIWLTDEKVMNNTTGFRIITALPQLCS